MTLEKPSLRQSNLTFCSSTHGFSCDISKDVESEQSTGKTGVKLSSEGITLTLKQNNRRAPVRPPIDSLDHVSFYSLFRTVEVVYNYVINWLDLAKATISIITELTEIRKAGLLTTT